MPAAIEGTYKNRDVEGLLDIYFYRRVGFALARLFAWLGMTPTGVTLLSGISGLAAGHLYYYRDLRLNLLGMGLHIVSNAFDNADGQLARLTNRRKSGWPHPRQRFGSHRLSWNLPAPCPALSCRGRFSSDLAAGPGRRPESCRAGRFRRLLPQRLSIFCCRSLTRRG